MNKPAPTALRNQAQGGFTLIELIVVIVILGILAATALPKFSALSGDARLASLNAARGALTSLSAVAHGQALINPTTAASPGLTYEGTLVTFVNNYPAAAKNTAIAAGITDTDYTVYATGDTVTNITIPANSIVIQPKAIADTVNGKDCVLIYTQAAGVNTPPVVALGSSTNAASCN